MCVCVCVKNSRQLGVSSLSAARFKASSSAPHLSCCSLCQAAASTSHLHFLANPDAAQSFKAKSQAADAAVRLVTLLVLPATSLSSGVQAWPLAAKVPTPSAGAPSSMPKRPRKMLCIFVLGVSDS